MASSKKPKPVAAATETAVAATRRTLERIETQNKALNAFIVLTPETAMAEAALADAKAAAGDARGVLHGVPIAVKDIIDLAGIVSGCGSLTTKQSPPAERDAAAVMRLRAAGAVIPGKTHTVEYAFGGYGTNVTVGTPKNPWDRKTHRIPGGSSSGSGAAVGGHLVPGALGTDTGGSVRIPAALCGCVGLKTSIGRVGRSRVAPLSQTLDSVGPLAQDVTMAARMFAALQGHDPDDATTDGVAAVDPFPDLERGITGMRFGHIADADMPSTTPEVRADFKAALERMAGLGARIEPVKLPHSFDDYGALCTGIMAPEAYANWRKFVDDPKSGMAAPIRARMLGGKNTTAADYLARIAAQKQAIAAVPRLFDRLDAILLPTIAFPAIPVSEVDESIGPMAALTRWVNYLNLAALAVPTALSKGGLPMSLQIVVRHMDDALALRIGRAFEKARGAFPNPPSA